MLQCAMLGAFTVTVHVVYFYYSDSIFAIKNFVTESILKVRSFMRDILALFDRGNVGWKMVYNFLGNDEKHGEISTYFRLKHDCRKEVRHFSVQ